MQILRKDPRLYVIVMPAFEEELLCKTVEQIRSSPKENKNVNEISVYFLSKDVHLFMFVHLQPQYSSDSKRSVKNVLSLCRSGFVRIQVS